IASEMASALLEEVKATNSMQEALANFQTKAAADDEASTESPDAEPAKLNPWDALSVQTTGMFSQEGQDMSAMFGAQFPGLNLGRSLWDRIPEIGKSPELAKDAFKEDADRELLKQTYSTGDAKIVARLKERKSPEAELSPEAQAELADEARQAKASN